MLCQSTVASLKDKQELLFIALRFSWNFLNTHTDFTLKKHRDTCTCTLPPKKPKQQQQQIPCPISSAKLLRFLLFFLFMDSFSIPKTCSVFRLCLHLATGSLRFLQGQHSSLPPGQHSPVSCNLQHIPLCSLFLLGNFQPPSHAPSPQTICNN